MDTDKTLKVPSSMKYQNLSIVCGIIGLVFLSLVDLASESNVFGYTQWAFDELWLMPMFSAASVFFSVAITLGITALILRSASSRYLLMMSLIMGAIGFVPISTFVSAIDEPGVTGAWEFLALMSLIPLLVSTVSQFASKYKGQ